MLNLKHCFAVNKRNSRTLIDKRFLSEELKLTKLVLFLLFLNLAVKRRKSFALVDLKHHWCPGN